MGLIHYGACSSFVGLRNRPFQGPMGSLGACGHDLVIFRISGPGSLSLGLRDLSPYSVGSSIGSRSFKGSGLAGRCHGKALVRGFTTTTTELSETWGHLS